MNLRTTVLLVLLASCTRAPPPGPAPAPERAAASASIVPVEPAAAIPAEAAVAAEPFDAGRIAPRIDGPHLLALTATRPIYYALPGAPSERPARLVAHLHGMCGPPSYACGKWLDAGVERGAVVCPTGNATCGDSPMGPPSWEAPTWNELVSLMNADLEASVAKVLARHPGALRREGAVLTGYSRGAFAAGVIARMRPNRWPYLVLIEANVPLDAPSLTKAGVRAVALVAGERGTEIAGERKTAEALSRDGVRARLFVMPRTGHLYSENMDEVMREALAFVLADDAGSR